MEEYMHVCTACNTYYSPNVATTVKNGKCKCGAPLVVSNITVEQYAKRSAAQSASSVSVPPAPVQIQYRKKPVPEMYTVPDRPNFAARVFACVSVFSLFFWCFDEVFLKLNFWAIPITIIGGCGAYLFASLCDAVFDILSHLGAIRWLMIHGDEVEPVPPSFSRTTPFDKQEGPKMSNKSFTIICIVLLALIVGGLILYNHLQ